MQNILTAIVNQDKGTLLDSFLVSLDEAVEVGGADLVDPGLHADTEDIAGLGLGLVLPSPILSYAITTSSPACVEVLINRSVSTDSGRDCLVRTTAQDVLSSVLLAARRGNAAALQIILRSHPEAAYAEDSSTGDKLLHLAARSQEPGGVECLGLLLDEYGRDIEERNRNNKTPIHVAALGRLESISSHL